MRKETRDVIECILIVSATIILLGAVLGVAVRVFRMIAY